ncbi:Uncharacterized protein FWK35_00024172 [Aphis craccivora]|uniref:Uncharacterized protein n=1 Tax=Aphis craccivora TaxID=307492 RepID=A0A6G0VSD4_APHCR|nr:Uncharacterized protein FWK35_00024172 [Aphis craccivora]
MAVALCKRPPVSTPGISIKGFSDSCCPDAEVWVGLLAIFAILCELQLFRIFATTTPVFASPRRFQRHFSGLWVTGETGSPAACTGGTAAPPKPHFWSRLDRKPIMAEHQSKAQYVKVDGGLPAGQGFLHGRCGRAHTPHLQACGVKHTIQQVPRVRTHAILLHWAWSLMPSPEVRKVFDAFNPHTDELEFISAVPEFEVSELLKAAKKMSSSKAGGPSGIPNEILKKIIIARPRGEPQDLQRVPKSAVVPGYLEKSKIARNLHEFAQPFPKSVWHRFARKTQFSMGRTRENQCCTNFGNGLELEKRFPLLAHGKLSFSDKPVPYKFRERSCEFMQITC